MNFKALLAPTVAFLLLSSAVHAASVTNRDGQDHTITVVEGDTKQDHVLKPNAVLQGICEKGCIIRLSGSNEDPYELEGSEVTSIEGGLLYDDGPGPLDAPDTGASGKPSEPSSRP
jgi:hypothetical protein